MRDPAVISFPRRHAATRRFTLGAPRSFSVGNDGETVLFLRSGGATDPANSLWAVSRGQDPRVVFDVAGETDDQLTAAERARRERTREQAGGIVGYSATGDCSTAVFVLGDDLHRVSVADGSATTIPAMEPFDPRPSADGRSIAYVSGRGMRIADGTDDRPIPRTEEDDEAVSWGSAEFVAAEEMGRSRGFWWGPDGSQLLVARVDVSAVAEWWIGSPEDPGTAPRAIRYPAAGTDNAAVELWLADPTTGPRRQVDWQSGRYEYLVSVSWHDRALCIVQSRDQRRMAILEIDPETGSTTELQRIEDERWVEFVPGMPITVGRRLATIVDDGDTRRIAIDGRSVSPRGLNVRGIHGAFDGRLVATVASDARGSVIVEIDGDGAVTELSEPDGYASVVAAAGTLCVSQTRIDRSPSHRIRWHDGTETELSSDAAEPGFDCTPSFSLGGRHRLHTALCLPKGHDGSPLPVLLDPYGGPHAQRVVLSRNAYATSQWFAEQGFAVVIVDGRGTPGRGPEFERAVWGDLAGPVLEDQVDALHALADGRDDLDLSRVGIRGWSFGGYLAALAVIRRPDVFHAAIAGAPVTDWRLYDTHYTERYLGHPDEYPEHYERTTLLQEAGSLERPLLLIHGLADDNVVVAHTLQLSRALLEAGRVHQVLPLAGITHMTPQEQVAESLLRLQCDFLRRELDGGGG